MTYDLLLYDNMCAHPTQNRIGSADLEVVQGQSEPKVYKCPFARSFHFPP